ncbi:hypothetical protein yfred0001_17110 [Yersinia frederiksenii ATCC 33641]|nr:hypothetical protein yfred0001_17110 [Yersinia frederiksenii ATCC 33641]
MTIIKMANWRLFVQQLLISPFLENNRLITHQHFSSHFDQKFAV